MNYQTHVVEAWGEFACFSSPIMKIERFSSAFPPPSAVRGVFDAIYCKPPEFRWAITRIEILKPISYIALRRNEVKDVVNLVAVDRWMSGKEEPEPIWADGDKTMLGTDEKGRTQRQTMALKNVRYRFHAQIRPWPQFKGSVSSLNEQFQRRLKQGKCFFQPCFGCREFPAYFSVPDKSIAPTAVDMDPGLMLYDVFDLSKPQQNDSRPAISLFRPRLRGGVVDIPEYESPEVLKTGQEVLSC